MFHGQHDMINQASFARQRASILTGPHGRAMRNASLDLARRAISMARYYRQRNELLAQADYWHQAALVAHRAGQSILGSSLHAKADQIERQAYCQPHPLV